TPGVNRRGAERIADAGPALIRRYKVYVIFGFRCGEHMPLDEATDRCTKQFRAFVAADKLVTFPLHPLTGGSCTPVITRDAVTNKHVPPLLIELGVFVGEELSHLFHTGRIQFE